MEPIMGTMVGRQSTGAEDPRRHPDGERRLLAAIIVEAIRAAQSGGAKAPDATAWLATVGCDWCERFLGITGIGPADWQRISLRAAQKIISANYVPLPRPCDPERDRQYRKRLRELGVQRLRDLPPEQRGA